MKMSKKGVICTMWCACLFPAVAAMAEDVVIKAGDLRITYVENGKQFNVEYNGLPARIHGVGAGGYVRHPW